MIPPSVQLAYKQQTPVADLLLTELDRLFGPRDQKWFYTARRKSLESYAQKLESGRCRDLFGTDDFVGAMLVVPMLEDLPAARKFVEKFFIVEEQRPGSLEETKKHASDFRFDDLRLFGHLRVEDGLPPRPIDSFRFEIQIKTFLQHAWAIATHDLVYKHDRASWRRSRVAYQVKALLEHADLSVASISQLESAASLPDAGQPETDIQNIIDLVGEEWSPDVLPRDRRRLAENLDRLLKSIGVGGLTEFKELLNCGKDDGGGAHPVGMSPYQCVIEYASRQQPEGLKKALRRKSERAQVIFVTDDVLRRIGVTRAEAINALHEDASGGLKESLSEA